MKRNESGEMARIRKDVTELVDWLDGYHYDVDSSAFRDAVDELVFRTWRATMMGGAAAPPILFGQGVMSLGYVMAALGWRLPVQVVRSRLPGAAVARRHWDREMA